MSDRLRFHNPEIPDPVFLHEVPLRTDKIGFFPSLKTQFLHGFWWKDVPNIAYRQEPGYESENPKDQVLAMVRVNSRVRYFLSALNMAPLEKAVVLGAYPGAMEIIDLNEEVLSRPRETNHTARYVEGGAIFTSLTNLPVYTIAADCAWSFIYAERDNQPSIAGIAHSGRREVEKFFPKTVISHLIDEYGCKPETMEIGITPSLEPEHHIIQAADLNKDVKYPHLWTPHYMRQFIKDGPYHLDVRSWIADQYIECGVNPDNITLSMVGTYESQEQGFGKSHRYAIMHGLEDGRMAVGFQLAVPRRTRS